MENLKEYILSHIYQNGGDITDAKLLLVKHTEKDLVLNMTGKNILHEVLQKMGNEFARSLFHRSLVCVAVQDIIIVLCLQ